MVAITNIKQDKYISYQNITQEHRLTKQNNVELSKTKKKLPHVLYHYILQYIWTSRNKMSTYKSNFIIIQDYLI